jgi:hypothetical protein
LRTICPGYPQSSILLISASQVVRITDVSHQRLARRGYLKQKCICWQRWLD